MKNNEVSGIGGWLLFLIVGLLFLGPLSAVWSNISEFLRAESLYPRLQTDPDWAVFKNASWLITGLVIAVSYIAGLALALNRTRRAVTLAKWLIITAGPIGSAIQSFFVAPQILHITFTPEYIGQGIGRLIAALVVALLWFAYLSRSVRVRNTYSLAT